MGYKLAARVVSTMAKEVGVSPLFNSFHHPGTYASHLQCDVFFEMKLMKT